LASAFIKRVAKLPLASAFIKRVAKLPLASAIGKKIKFANCGKKKEYE
jgi:hypothetical protein